MTGKKTHKKPLNEQAPLFEHKAAEQIEPLHVDLSLAPIVDKRSYDRFIKIISLRVYTEFEKTMKDAGILRPELELVGFDLKKMATETDARMSNYVALNARLILEKAFVDCYDYASKYMPRVMREMHIAGSVDIAEFMEDKIRHDIMMEIRSIAMVHIPESERYGYRNKLKVL